METIRTLEVLRNYIFTTSASVMKMDWSHGLCNDMQKNREESMNDEKGRHLTALIDRQCFVFVGFNGVGLQLFRKQRLCRP